MSSFTHNRGSSLKAAISSIGFWSRFYPIVAFLYLVAIGASYTSLIGLVKYARMYGLYSDIAAELGNCQERYELQ